MSISVARILLGAAVIANATAAILWLGGTAHILIGAIFVALSLGELVWLVWLEIDWRRYLKQRVLDVFD